MKPTVATIPTRLRVNYAFKMMREAGIVARLSGEPKRDFPVGTRVVYVDNSASAWCGGTLVDDLSISFGVVSDPTSAATDEVLGAEIVAHLRSAGLEPEWGGHYYDAIVVRPVAGVDFFPEAR